ncbi:hypothetical protein PCASD_00096 [Puccinia coronata f. sp. avenae]|uniref:Uncharacterized protein n=1 Tax=Puccinia coronata f. sp. avenae TaxID=200324 RepID=A0A2N5VQN1_9BASI|nr:hypothetical protein PCASD_00096 [Puccinia coronata f. sp. avenae]
MEPPLVLIGTSSSQPTPAIQNRSTGAFLLHLESLVEVWQITRSLQSGWVFGFTAGINRSNTAARAVLEQPCSTGVRTDTVRPKREPTGRTDLSDRSRLVLCNRSQELIGQACPTRRQVLRSDSACPTTGRTRLFEHRSNCRVRPVNAGSAWRIDEDPGKPRISRLV